MSRKVVLADGETVLFPGQTTPYVVGEKWQLPLLGEVPYLSETFQVVVHRRVNEQRFLLVTSQILPPE